MLNRLLRPPALVALLLSACASHNADAPRLQPTSEALSQDVAQSSSLALFDTEQPTWLAASQPVTGILIPDLPRNGQAPDFWDTLRTAFALPEHDNKRVSEQRNWYFKHPEYLLRVTERAQRYAWHINKEVAKRGMPSEIVLLPIVESAYDPFAYSHGRAAGLWQFIPATGKRYGLKQDWWYDGRRDVVDSTTAALDYLEYLQRRFNGDWLLALAAYNSGEGTVLKAQRRNRKNGRPTGFWQLDLPRETRDYVPKLIALKQLVASPERYDIELEPIANRAYFEIIDTDAQIDLAVAADLADIPLEALYRLNPGFNRWATAPEGPHRLLIPAEQADSFRQAIAELPAEQRLKWVRHKVSSGETLSHIAKRYNTTISALKAANDLAGSTIGAGKFLMVPVSSREQASYPLSAGQRLSNKQNKTRRGQKIEHIVDSGDTFWDLARHYKVGVRSLAAWNNMAPGDTLRVGQKLVVWVNQSTPRSVHPGTQLRAVHYKVRKGDSLSRISNRFKVSVADLRKWNGLSKDRYLQPGQHLKLYVDVTRQASGT
jgi:membrane-bound lytic murein transglycosylase D